MIIFDTNVISELMKSALDPRVDQWMQAHRGETAATTTVNVYEIQFGLSRLPAGRRRSDLAARFEHVIASPRFVLLPLTEAAARNAGAFMATRYAQGRLVGDADMMIAGIAADLGALIATRNVRDFDGLGLTVVDPWTP